MRKFVAIALAALMLLALIPSASALPTGSWQNMTVNYFDNTTLKSVSPSISGSSITINKALSDMYSWNISGTAINSQLAGSSTWGKFVQFTCDLVVAQGAAVTVPTATFSSKELAIAAADVTLASIAPKTFYINGVSYMAFARVAPETAVFNTTSNLLTSANYEYRIPSYTFFYLPIAGGNTQAYTVTAYENNQVYNKIDFLFYIQYNDLIPANSTNVTVVDYDVNKDNVRAYISGDSLFIETVWANLISAKDTDQLVNNAVNPNYQASAGYYPIDLQFFFKDTAGNPLPQYAQITALNYDGAFDILAASIDKSKAEYLPFQIKSAITPNNSGFGRTTYLDADGSFKLRINIGQYGYMDAVAGKSARFITPFWYGQIAANPASATSFVTDSATVYTQSAIATLLGQKSLTASTLPNMTSSPYTLPVFWLTDLQNSTLYIGKKLNFTVNVSGVMYNFSQTIKFQSVNRTGAYSLSLSETNMTVKVGETKALNAVVGNPFGNMQALPINWSVNNAAIAKLSTVVTSNNYNATVTGVAVGTTYVRAVIDSIETICNVTVVAADETTVAPSTVDYVVTCRALNVRTGAGTKNSKVGMTYRGDVLKVIEVKNDWAKIEWQGSTAYACLGSGKYLQAK